MRLCQHIDFSESLASPKRYRSWLSYSSICIQSFGTSLDHRMFGFEKRHKRVSLLRNFSCLSWGKGSLCWISSCWTAAIACKTQSYLQLNQELEDFQRFRWWVAWDKILHWILSASTLCSSIVWIVFCRTSIAGTHLKWKGKWFSISSMLEFQHSSCFAPLNHLAFETATRGSIKLLLQVFAWRAKHLLRR